jgi:hypothetical protein
MLSKVTRKHFEVIGWSVRCRLIAHRRHLLNDLFVCRTPSHRYAVEWRDGALLI